MVCFLVFEVVVNLLLLQMMAFDGKAEAAQFCFEKAAVSLIWLLHFKLVFFHWFLICL